MAVADDIEMGEGLLIIAVIAVVGYYLYKAFTKTSSTVAQNAPVGAAAVLATIPGGGSLISDSTVIPDTGGVTAGQLRQAGWPDSDIANFNAAMTTTEAVTSDTTGSN